MLRFYSRFTKFPQSLSTSLDYFYYLTILFTYYCSYLAISVFKAQLVRGEIIPVLSGRFVPNNKTRTSKVGAKSKAQRLNKRKVFKIEKRGTIRVFWKSILLQNIKKNLKEALLGPNKSSENVAQSRKKWKGGPFSLARISKCSKKFLAKARTRIRDRWVSSRKPIEICTKKWNIHDEACGLTKKRKKTSHCNSRALFI